MKKILVTGSAGFIGFHLVKALLKDGFDVVGIDNLNDYYDPNLKDSRLKVLQNLKDENLLGSYAFVKLDIANYKNLDALFKEHNFDIVYNLAAQAGVRYSLENPSTYIQSNIVGFTNILECCRNSKIKHLIYASSSSVYGMNIKQPFSTSDRTDYPVSLYAATKKSNELLAFSYSHLFKIPCTGLRFFTVYGPYGRPDMAYYKFAKLIDNGEKIDVYNNGNMKRDFTYIDDIIEGLKRIMYEVPSIKSSEYSTADAPSRVLNIGNNNPVTLHEFIQAIEISLGKKADKNFLPMQPGDVPSTYADIDDLVDLVGFKPKTSIDDGMKNFINWFQDNK
jgi:UDP-glucuronate 4-epimerase